MGPDATTETSPDTSTTADPATTTSASASTTTSSPTTTGAPTTGATTTGASTTTVDPDTTTTDTTVNPDTTTTDTTINPDTTTTDTTTGDPGNGTYAAFYLPGGLDRILVRKADTDADLCTSVLFVWPGMPSPGLTLPPEWGLQWAQIHDGAADCLDPQAQLVNGVFGDPVTGSADWITMDFCPQTLDIDVVVTFPPEQPWVPPKDTLKATALPVQGC